MARIIRNAVHRKQKSDFWRLNRYDKLVDEGFTPEEASIISTVRISSSAVKRLRRQRKRMVLIATRSGLTHKQAIDLIRAEQRQNQQEILTWPDLRKILYPQSYRVV